MDYTEILKLVGALGLFIYGMMVMSDGIQKMAGTRMRSILGSITSSRFKGIFTGFFTTTLIQSSSATTVMIVSFVNAGLLSLRQAIGVIMGANIGTTMTAWLLVIFGFSKFSLGDYVFPILAIGVPLLFVNRGNWKNLGEFLVGFALLFLGLSGMKEAVEGLDLANSAGFRSMIAYLSEKGFLGIMMLVIVGTIVTVVVQSSSAAMALTLSLCGTMGLPFEMAAAIVLGENIGTTITANIAALVGNVHAKRAARAHFIFNIFGVVWMLLVFYWFTSGIGWLMQHTQWGSPFGNANDESIRYSLSAFHTVFNIINTLILVWFVSLIERTVVRFTPSKGEEDEVFKLEYIGSGILATPELSVLEAKKELVKFGQLLLKMHKKTLKLVNATGKKEQTALIIKIKSYEEVTDRIHHEISSFLAKASSKEVSESTSEQIRGLLGASSDLESIGDIYFNMAMQIEKKTKDKVWFDQKQRDYLTKYFSQIIEAYDEMVSNLDQKVEVLNISKAAELEQEINATRDKLRKKHLKSIEKQEYNYHSGLIYNNLFSSLEKVGDYIISVSEYISGKNLI
ncbi:MAG: Na/Pi cotransporter family protein [Bacteroidetes bacterium]|nr:Na/Pi cotransporter family protein [Bacteroidota bacterium]